MNPYQHRNYFDWLCKIVKADSFGPFYVYRNLLTRLFQTDFEPIRYMDDNREVNGKMLRYYFEANRDDYASHEQAPNHIYGDFYENTKDEPCSMLEMMIAFAKDIDVMYLYSTTSRVFIWFWSMIESLGLTEYQDGLWDNRAVYNQVDETLRVFIIDAHQMDEFGYWVPTITILPVANREALSETRSLWDQMQLWYNEHEYWLENITEEEYINYYTCAYMYG